MSDSGVTIVKKGDIEIRIIRDLCIGAATCVVYGPETFDIDAEGKAVTKEGEWDRLEKIIAAAKSCPTFAIEVYQNGVKLYPK